MAKKKESRHVLFFLWLGSLCSRTIEVFLIRAFFLGLQLCGNIRFYDHPLIFDANTNIEFNLTQKLNFGSWHC